MDFFRTHRFSVASLALSLAGLLFVPAAVLHFRHQGTWAPQTRAYGAVTAVGGLCLLLSLVTALTALIRERSRLAVVAFLVSLLNFFFYAR
jgi:hypothetical protein